jgi:hypothetical protein
LIAAHRNRQAGQQQRHPRHIAVVLAGLVGAAIDHVIHRLPVEPRVSLHQFLQRVCREIVGPHRGENAAESADWRSHIVANEGFGHVACHPSIGPGRIVTDRGEVGNRRSIALHLLGYLAG